MRIESGLNYLGEELYDIYDDNGRYVMEQCLVEGRAKGEYFNGFVLTVRKDFFKIGNALTAKVIDYADIESLRRLNDIN